VSTKLWDKGGASDAAVLAYTSRDDYKLDQALLKYDLRASIAHVRGLARIGALDSGDRDRIVEALRAIEKEEQEGRFVLGPEVEDGHTAIEVALVARLGDTGKRVHLGRSRNDQVLTALRLYLKDTLSRLVARSAASAAALLELAKKGEHVVLPGYTHLQRAVPQTLGHWAAGFAEGMIESGYAIADARDRADRSPLGAAAGYGVNLGLDREGVAHELGFDEIDINPLWSQTSRGLLEIVALSAVFHASALVRRLAWDLSLFTTAEFGFVKLPDELTTGSSIMPNKRNPDVVELMRGSCSIVQGAITELMSLVSLPSGYHRDLQLMKAPLMRALSEADATLSLVPKLVSELRFDEKKMAAAVTEDTLATDQAVDLARGGMPFRDAYKRIAAAGLSGETPAGARAEASIAARISFGSSGNLALDRIAARLTRLEELLSKSPKSEWAPL
jgi:argininosuccinate lyase